MDSRARECENPAYLVILAHNCDLGEPMIPQSTKKWRIFVSYVRIVVLFSTILVVYFRSFPPISVDLVVRDLTETSVLLAETVDACAYVFLLSLSLTQVACFVLASSLSITRQPATNLFILCCHGSSQ